MVVVNLDYYYVFLAEISTRSLIHKCISTPIKKAEQTSARGNTHDSRFRFLLEHFAGHKYSPSWSYIYIWGISCWRKTISRCGRNKVNDIFTFFRFLLNYSFIRECYLNTDLFFPLLAWHKTMNFSLALEVEKLWYDCHNIIQFMLYAHNGQLNA